MDLWVRSQDKTRLVKVCSLEYGEYNEIHYINGYCVNEVDNYDLGTYKTKERALEVLDEIQRILKPVVFMSGKINTDDNKWVENGIIFQKYKDTTPDIKMLDTYVYEMPEE